MSGLERSRILVAEDMETNQKIINEMLHLLGCDVDIAPNGEVAVELYTSNSYDLIFMDCQMPVMDGYVASRAIRDSERKDQFQPIPIIALTAGFDKSDKKRCQEAGMDHYLTKPFSISEITRVLQSFIGHSGRMSPVNGKEENRKPNATPPHFESKMVVDRENVLNFSAIGNILEVERQTQKPILASIFDGFTLQMDEKLEELQSNVVESGPECLYQTAHAIKSMSANIGAKKVQQISAEIEVIARSGSHTQLKGRVDELNGAYKEFLVVFKLEHPDL